ncbi:phosphatase [Salmonella enterica subsp. enterica serovar Typhimurium]|uniref:Phosphatase n=2 Tax=Salmonella enterica I TaxID=59201 RepID=A0A345JGY4_SALET|nr:hypothetical protein SeHA_C3006 [Salmonella enterica subsp. enterica serovar Heidelberg str. SL476]AEZ46515.1 hypothetical protein STBHUCCB_28660 [Salmonella enterica subsp. enterica serovar Typhi str. P-stx-12]AFH46637.1 Phosphatase YqaB [Salmonella enterica subsp. enterica serovar Heidelberg str. B182]AGK10456.1 Phosphatase YqaB [Salmonella enterica subsp. enterica serovar Typhimurium str. U288]AGQ66163.1 Phosphatase YqaB [Salmonella enterica subsp. enterica serovar Heidelberg str. 41578]
MHHILHTFSDEDADKIAVITAGIRRITLHQQRPEGRVILPDTLLPCNRFSPLS